MNLSNAGSCSYAPNAAVWTHNERAKGEHMPTRRERIQFFDDVDALLGKVKDAIERVDQKGSLNEEQRANLKFATIAVDGLRVFLKGAQPLNFVPPQRKK